jgi:hypothetical protein
MCYIVCPECGDILGHRCIVYEDEMQKICNDLGINYDMMSQQGFDGNEQFVKKRQEIINKLCTNICCKMNIISYISTVRLIKG